MSLLRELDNPWRLLVSGSRLWDMDAILRMVLINKWIAHPGLVIVHGDCPTGADNMAKQFALDYNVPEERFPADWTKYGKAAGAIRNREMVKTYPDFALFFIQGESKGTLGCLKEARKVGIPYEPYGETWRIKT